MTAQQLGPLQTSAIEAALAVPENKRNYRKLYDPTNKSFCFLGAVGQALGINVTISPAQPAYDAIVKKLKLGCPKQIYTMNDCEVAWEVIARRIKAAPEDYFYKSV